MQFRVPQFIDIEDKIFGPFTFKQFIYLIGGGGIVFILLKVLPIYLAIPLSIPVAAFALALTYYRVNNKPFVSILESFMKYQMSNKLYIWKHRKQSATAAASEPDAPATLLPSLTSSKLKDLSWSLDVLDNKAQAEEAADMDKIVEKNLKTKYDLKI